MARVRDVCVDELPSELRPLYKNFVTSTAISRIRCGSAFTCRDAAPYTACWLSGVRRAHFRGASWKYRS